MASAFGDELKIQINQDYFKRMFVHSGNISLNIELINDVPYHIGDFWSNDQFNRIDNWQNILSNKVSALNRNEERDIIDILFFSYRFQFQWRDIVDQLKKKIRGLKKSMWHNTLPIYRSLILFVGLTQSGEKKLI